MRKSLFIVVLAIGCGGSETTNCEDTDGDGVTNCDGDCDDGDALANPAGNEICGDNADNNCDGVKEEGCPGGVGTFVSTATGDDANPGTKAAPVKTIARGMANATVIGGSQTVIVGQGTYAEKVSLAEGIDLQGGYQCDATACAWTRDVIVNESVIENQDFEGVAAAAGVTAATLFEGFRIAGRDGQATAPGSIGFTFAGGSPTVSRNRINGGAVTGTGFGEARSIAVLFRSTTDPAGALLEANELLGGRANQLSAGIAFDGAGQQTKALATVRGNMIRGGEGTRAIGIVAFNSLAGTLVTDNDIYGGNATSTSHGIEVGSQMTIDRNRINVDQNLAGSCAANGTTTRGWCTGITSDSSTTTITNNVVFGAKGPRSAAVLLGEFEVPAGAVVVNGNTLNGNGSGAGIAPTESAAVVLTIGPCNTCGFNGVVGRIRNNIFDGGINGARFGLREDPAQGKVMHAEQLENNLFFFSPSTGGPSRQDVFVMLMSANGPKPLTTIDMVNMMTTPVATKNIAGDPKLDATWHLLPGSPCESAGTAAEAPTTDFEGDTRPNGSAVEIGHDEM